MPRRDVGGAGGRDCLVKEPGEQKFPVIVSPAGGDEDKAFSVDAW